MTATTTSRLHPTSIPSLFLPPPFTLSPLPPLPPSPSPSILVIPRLPRLPINSKPALALFVIRGPIGRERTRRSPRRARSAVADGAVVRPDLRLGGVELAPRVEADVILGGVRKREEGGGKGEGSV